jgi:hypothetical protein
MKKLLIAFGLIALCSTAKAQHPKITDTAGYRVIEEKKASFPKFYKVLHDVLENEPLLKQLAFINKKGAGPGKANAQMGRVTINLNNFINKNPQIDDNRMVVILYHEIGHLHYAKNTPVEQKNSEDNEKAAFEYSLLKTKDMAKQGDCGPLKTGLHFMLLRSKSNNTNDPHVRALKRMIKEPLYESYVTYQKEHCK